MKPGISEKKLAYLCSSVSWGGLEMNQLRNARWMKKRGHLVLVLCKENSPIANACHEEKIPLAYIGSHKKYYDFSAGKKLAGILEQHQITHLLIRDTRDMSVSVIAKRKAKHAVHLSYFMEMQLGVAKKHALHSIRFRGLDLWSCPLNWLADQVREMTHMDRSRIHVIPTAMDLERFETAPSREDARKILDLPADCRLIGLSGRFDPFKGHLLLLEAVNQLSDKEVCICFLGEATKGDGTEYIDQVNATIQNYALSERVFIRPFRKDIEVFYAAIDVFVMASKAETFGMVTIEAMASGIPLIASNSGGSPEILAHGKLGKLFEPGSAEGLTAQLEDFLKSDPADRDQLRAAARLYDHHSVCAQVEKVLGL